jgi:hypothetical protein
VTKDEIGRLEIPGTILDVVLDPSDRFLYVHEGDKVSVVSVADGKRVGRFSVGSGWRKLSTAMAGLGHWVRGGGTIGIVELVRAKPDGYTLLLGNKGGLITAPLTKKDLGYSLDDFAPVCNLFRSPNFWFVKEDTGFKTLRDWFAAAKTKKMKYSTY